MSLSYTGADEGVFAARGTRAADWSTRTHAAGGRWDGHITVRSYALRGGNLADQFVLSGTVAEPGTYPFDPDRGTGSVYAELALDVQTAANTARAIYVLVSGSATLEPNTDGRIRGRFDGTARLLNGASTIQIIDGRFDVPNNLPPPVMD